MSTIRIVLIVLSACLVVAHLSGNMRALLEALDIGIEPRDLPFLLALPIVALFGLTALRN